MGQSASKIGKFFLYLIFNKFLYCLVFLSREKKLDKLFLEGIIRVERNFVLGKI